MTHLDVVEISRILESRLLPIQVLHPSIDLRIVMSDRASALEMTSVDWIVADCGGVQADIGFCQGIADEVVFAFEMLVQAVKRLVEWVVVGLVCFLCGSEAAVSRP